MTLNAVLSEAAASGIKFCRLKLDASQPLNVIYFKTHFLLCRLQLLDLTPFC
jgi:hypothetical protein